MNAPETHQPTLIEQPTNIETSMDDLSQNDNALIESIAPEYKFSDLSSVKRFSSGQINRVYEVDGKYIVKIKGKGVEGLDLFGWQPQVLNSLHNAGTKVPKVFGHGNTDKGEYLIMEKLAGENLSYQWLELGAKEKESLMAQLAEQLKLFHSLSFDHYAVPVVTGKQYKTFEPAVRDINNIPGLDKSKLNKQYQEDLEFLLAFYDQHSNLLNEQDTATSIHHDINLENVFWKDGKITGIIDVDWLCYAPRDYELQRIVHYARMPKYCVEEALESKYANYQMTQEVKWLKQYYPEMFANPNVTNRVRLYLIDNMLSTARGYTSEQWSENVMVEWHQLVQDYYQNDWLPKLLES